MTTQRSIKLKIALLSALLIMGAGIGPANAHGSGQSIAPLVTFMALGYALNQHSDRHYYYYDKRDRRDHRQNHRHHYKQRQRSHSYGGYSRKQNRHDRY